MSRTTVSRGIPALVFVFALTLAGASPAAAADLGFRDFSFGPLVSGFWGEVTGWLSGADKRGFGIDPNGVAVAAQPDPEPDPPSQANPQGQPFSPHGHP